MMGFRTLFALELATGLAILGGGGMQAALAAAPGSADTNSLQREINSSPLLDPVQGGIIPPTTDPMGGLQTPAREREPRGNPLWAIPLKSLSATREKPLFTPSRRAPAPAVAGAPVVVPVDPPQQAGPERPHLSLVGAVIGETEGLAVFLDDATRQVIRLRTGENHEGWILRAVKGREATLQKEREPVILRLPAPSEGQKPSSPEL
jgi:general secretion pathway protein N